MKSSLSFWMSAAMLAAGSMGCGVAVVDANENIVEETPEVPPTPGEPKPEPKPEPQPEPKPGIASVEECPNCVLRCASGSEQGGLGAQTFRVYVEKLEPGVAYGDVTVRVVQGPTHVETRSGAAFMPFHTVVDQVGSAELEPAFDETFMSANVNFPGGKLSASMTYSYLEMVGTIEFEGQERPVTCWNPADAKTKRTYNGESVGHCWYGEANGTPYSVEFLRETNDGECSSPMHDGLAEGSLDEPVLRGWNLQGASLFTPLVGADLLDADLRGAKFSEEFTYSNARITGRIDIHTVLPATGCVVKGDWADCKN